MASVPLWNNNLRWRLLILREHIWRHEKRSNKKVLTTKVLRSVQNLAGLDAEVEMNLLFESG